MIVTFLIGNGFDLQNKMNTTFNHFFDYISENKILSDDNYILKKFKEDNNKEKWSDFELQLGKLTFNLTKENTDKFMDDFLDFREQFINYMEREQEKFQIKDKDVYTIMYNTLKGISDALRDNEKTYIENLFNSNNNEIFFLNFNYTNTLEQIILNIDQPIKTSDYSCYIKDLIAIHRTLKDGTFLGVNDETQLNASIFNQDELDSLIKPLNNESEMTNSYKKVDYIINNSQIIYIFGMSLGATDKYWWEKLAKWLLADSRRRLIINSYLDSELKIKTTLHSLILKRIIRQVKNKFTSHLNYEEEQILELQNQIYIAISSDQILNCNII